MATLLDTKGWELIDEDFDLQPEAGSFVSSNREKQVYEIFGVPIKALNWRHATYVWLWNRLENQGDLRHKCAKCNHYVRYVDIYKTPNDEYKIVGRDCSETIERFNAGQARPEIMKAKRQMAMMRDAVQRETRNGQRWCVYMSIPNGFWNIPKSKRPTFVSPWKGDDGEWRLTFYAENREDLPSMDEELQALLNSEQEADPVVEDKSQWIGEVGKRCDWICTVEAIRHVNTEYGSFTVTTFLTDKGDRLSYKGNKLGIEIERRRREPRGDFAFNQRAYDPDDDTCARDFVWYEQKDLKVGDRIKIKGTIKSHNEYKGKKETRLSRPKLVEIL